MLQVYICVGSSCHLKGSHHIIQTFQRLIKEYGLEQKIELKASFCLGHCTQGVSVKVENDFIEGITVSNVEEKFKECILGRL
ncbi:MAG: (2Fe-2S) ferredoxin domain-containing protein [Firmicutes bacterium]|nr:(2Fe-2S) ferredoxin domain-containing protein [Bacillota bacterium]